MLLAGAHFGKADFLLRRADLSQYSSCSKLSDMEEGPTIFIYFGRENQRPKYG